MPGLYGTLFPEAADGSSIFESMLGTLTYGRATIVESYASHGLHLGCSHLGTGGQRALYRSSQVCVAFYGYLTEPSIPPGAEGNDAAAAAHYIHDCYLRSEEAFLLGLEGAFALALWDTRSETLILAGDKIGMRPIYYAFDRGGFCFASEVKGILANPSIPRRLDLTAAAEFFHLGHILGARTFFEDIKLLPPASYLSWRSGSWKVVTYWEPTYPDHFDKRPDRWYDEQIYERLRDAVRKMVRPNLCYGISLSSGMDSRWIAGVLSEVRADTQAFTFQGAITSPAEAEVASQVAALTGLRHHSLPLPPNFVAADAEQIAYISDGMLSFVDAQEFPLVLEMSQFVDVAVGGFMGSGFFGHHPIHYLPRPQDVLGMQIRMKSRHGPSRAIMARIFGREKSAELERVAFEGLKNTDTEAHARHGFQILSYADIRERQRRFTFAAQLLKSPYVEMYHPIADNRVWELSLQLPPSQLIFKRALRRSLGRYLPNLAALSWNKVQGPATASVPYILAQESLRRVGNSVGKAVRLSKSPAAGSSLRDYSDWLRGPLRSFVETNLLSSEALAAGLFDHDGFRGVVREYLDGELDITGFVGLALPFVYWIRMFYLPTVPKRPEVLGGIPSAAQQVLA